MGVWDRIVGFFSAREGFKRARYRAASDLLSRKYEGASVGRRTKNWKAASSSANAEIESSLVTLRNRSRQLVRDNPYSAKAMQVITANVVGWGIVGQVKVDAAQKNSSGINKQATGRTAELNNAFKSFIESNAIDFDGRNNFYGLQRLIMRGVAESGEMLIRLRRVGRRKIIGADGFEIEIPPIALQILEGDFLSVVNNGISVAEGSNQIIQGIEFDANGKRVAYHLYEEHPGNNGSSMSASKSRFKTVRVPADEVLHVYRLDRPGQIRGVPWLAPVMLRLKDFDEYEDAQLVRQKIAAMFAVFIKDLDGVDNTLAGTAEAELGEKVEPGIIEILPPGKDITLAQPPTVQGYAEYSSNVLHAIAAGLGITYESLTGDLSQVNFSSARMGFLEMNRLIDEWRDDVMLAQVLNPFFQWWMSAMEIVGYDTARARAVWSAPRREMVDPGKETEAAKAAVRAGFVTLSEVIRNNGYDPERHFQEMAQDKKLLDQLGLVLDSDPSQDAKRIQATQSPAPQPAP